MVKQLCLVICVICSIPSLAEVSYSGDLTRQIKLKRQDEAKKALRFLSTVEQAYYSEYGEYGTYIVGMGYEPDNGEMNYQVGFTKHFEPSALVLTNQPNIKSNPAKNTLELFSLLLSKFNGVLDFGPMYDPETGGVIPGRRAFWFNPSHKVERINFDNRALQVCVGDCTASAAGFKAMAVGNIDLDSTLDIWTINERGELLNHSNDSLQ